VKPSPAFTGPGRKNSLKVNEPPSPAAGKGGQGIGAGQTANQNPISPPAGGDTNNLAPDADGDVRAMVAGLSSGNCPVGMAPVGSFCIDRFEAALVDSESGQPWSPYEVPKPSKKYKAVSAALQMPQGYISGVEAKKACANAGKRLCSQSEWMTACQGPKRTTYPYGNDVQPRTCNEHDHEKGYSSAILRVFPGFTFDDNGKMNDPRINQQSGSVALRQIPSAETTAGSGTWWATCTSGWDDPDGTFKGGYYVDTYRNGPGCMYKTTAHPPSYHDYSIGFRCCASPAN
jgi:hypothetical protein